MQSALDNSWHAQHLGLGLHNFASAAVPLPTHHCGALQRRAGTTKLPSADHTANQRVCPFSDNCFEVYLTKRSGTRASQTAAPKAMYCSCLPVEAPDAVVPLPSYHP